MLTDTLPSQNMAISVLLSGKCHKKLSEVQQMPGAFVPSCEADGRYSKQQCHGSTGHCWCVDQETGKGIDGTGTAPGELRIDCDQGSDADLASSGVIFINTRHDSKTFSIILLAIVAIYLLLLT